MKKKLVILLAALLIFALPFSASATQLELKPVADPWDDPANLITDGGTYTAYDGDDGYIVAWETPECDLDGGYLLIENGTELKIDYRVSYMGDVPWGHVVVAPADGGADFDGWVLMSDVLDENGNPAASAPVEVPEHPVIADPTPEPTETAEDPEATATAAVPDRPEEAINISNTYNSAIVYTSVAIAAVAIAFAVYVLIKHKALNKKGE